MALGADRHASRADTLVLLGCLGLSLAAMSLPPAWRDPVASAMRQTILAPFLELQRESELLRTSRSRFDAITAQRDSSALAATFLPELRAENERLRGLLGLGQRLASGSAPAEVLHQAAPTDPLALVISAGRREGVRPLAAVVSPEGLIGLVSTVDARTSVVVTWANLEFRASAMAADGSVYGIVAPHGTEGPGVWLLELQGIPYRQSVALGTSILTSGLGGVFPRGIPLGTVVDSAATEEGWQRTYLVRPAVHPSAVSHVMILTGGRSGTPGDLRGVFERGEQGP